MINLNTCQPGQQLIRRDGLRAEYISRTDGCVFKFRHRVKVYYSSAKGAVRSYGDDGKFLITSSCSPADIIEILPMSADPVWSAKISPDRVEASSGFWAVYQGEA